MNARAPGTMRLAVVLLPAALLVRVVCSARTVAPDRDTANYVSMARDFVGGDWRLALAEPFPPLHPVLLSVFAFWSDDNVVCWRVGQVLVTLLSCVAVVLTARAARDVFGATAAWITGLWFAFAMLPAWQSADAMSEPLFQVLAAAWVLAWSKDRPRLHAGFAGLCFVTRLEGIVLVVGSVYRAFRTRSIGEGVRCGVLAVVPGVLYLGLRGVATGSFELLPKISFMQPVSSFGEHGSGAIAASYVGELGRFLAQGFDGLGYLALPGLVVGLVLLWRSAEPAVWRGPVLLALGALLVVPFFFANRRFWTPWLPLLLPVASLPFAVLLGRRRAWTIGLLVFGLLPHALRLGRARRPSLAADRAVGAYLDRTLAHDGAIASDLPRLVFFAGRHALPARSIESRELMELAAKPDTLAVVSLARREKLDVPHLRVLGYRVSVLPSALAEFARRRGIVVYTR